VLLLVEALLNTFMFTLSADGVEIQISWSLLRIQKFCLRHWTLVHLEFVQHGSRARNHE